MTDALALVRAWLVSIAAITNLTSTARIYALPEPPAGYNTGLGAALLFGVRPSKPDYTSRVLDTHLQFRSIASTWVVARQLDMALFDAINDKRAAGIKFGRCEQLGQDLPITLSGQDWPAVLSFYRFIIAN